MRNRALAAVTAGLLAASLAMAAGPGGARARARGGRTGATDLLQEALAGVLQAITSETLRPFIPRLEQLRDFANAGQFAEGAQAAKQICDELAATQVVQQEMAPRAVLLALATGLYGDLLGLSGRPNDGQRMWRSIQEMPVSDDLKAMALTGEAMLSLLDLQFGTAGALEKRAARALPDVIIPILPGVERLWLGDPAGALQILQPAVLGGASREYALLYAALAALSLDRMGQAASYLDQARPMIGFHPHFYLGAGLLTAAAGDLGEAQRLFADGTRNEQGRLHLCGLLSGVADIAGGQTQRGLATMGRYLGSVPPNFRRVAEAIMGSPSLASKALRKPGVWFLPFSMSALNSADSTPFEIRPQPTVTEDGELRGGAAPQTEAGPQTGAPTGGAGGTTTQARGAGGLLALDASTQAVEAYGTALKLIEADRAGEAERVLLTAVGLRPQFPEAWQALGLLRLQRGDARAALEAYVVAVRQRPASAEALYGAALCLDRLGRAVEARGAYNAAVEAGLTGELAAYARGRLAALSG